MYEVTSGLDLRKRRIKALPTADAEPQNSDPGFLLNHPTPNHVFHYHKKIYAQYSLDLKPLTNHIDLSKTEGRPP
jgi:hypothetical protein